MEVDEQSWPQRFNQAGNFASAETCDEGVCKCYSLESVHVLRSVVCGIQHNHLPALSSCAMFCSHACTCELDGLSICLPLSLLVIGASEYPTTISLEPERHLGMGAEPVYLPSSGRESNCAMFAVTRG